MQRAEFSIKEFRMGFAQPASGVLDSVREFDARAPAQFATRFRGIEPGHDFENVDSCPGGEEKSIREM